MQNFPFHFSFFPGVVSPALLFEGGGEGASGPFPWLSGGEVVEGGEVEEGRGLDEEGGGEEEEGSVASPVIDGSLNKK